MQKAEKLKYGIGNSPVNCVLKRLGLIDRIKLVEPPGYLDDKRPKQKITNIFLLPHSPIIIYFGSSGKDWLLYLRRHFKKRSPFFLHIGFPAIPNSGWIKGEKIIPPMGHSSLKIPSLHQILIFLSKANEMKRVNEEERLFIFSLFGWQESFKSTKSIQHSLKIADAADIIKKIEKKVEEKELNTWEQIKCEFNIKRGETDLEKMKKIQVRGFLNVIERHWKLTSHSKAKK